MSVVALKVVGGQVVCDATTSAYGDRRASKWVLNKAREVQWCIGLSCEGFEDQFIALLTAIEIGQPPSCSVPECTLAKGREAAYLVGKL